VHQLDAVEWVMIAQALSYRRWLLLLIYNIFFIRHSVTSKLSSLGELEGIWTKCGVAVDLGKWIRDGFQSFASVASDRLV
jgi:hypothetical protein